MTRGSKWTPRSKRYFDWVKQVRLFWKAEPMDHCTLDVVVKDGEFMVSVSRCDKGCKPKMRGDLDNMLKAVSDALNGVAFTDDSVKHLCSVSCKYEGAENDAAEGSLGQDSRVRGSLVKRPERPRRSNLPRNRKE
jgi:hypothetical protein